MLPLWPDHERMKKTLVLYPRSYAKESPLSISIFNDLFLLTSEDKYPLQLYVLTEIVGDIYLLVSISAIPWYDTDLIYKVPRNIGKKSALEIPTSIGETVNVYVGFPT